MTSPRVCLPTSWIPPNNPSFKYFDSMEFNRKTKNSKAEVVLRTWILIFGKCGSDHQMRNLEGAPVCCCRFEVPR